MRDQDDARREHANAPDLFSCARATVLCWLSAPLAAQPKQDPPGQNLGIASVANLRDIGGYTTRDGAIVRTKLLYRSNQLSRISPNDMKRIAALGLKNEYDLRTAEERAELPDELPPGVNNIWLNVLADSDQSAPAQLGKLLQKPLEANAALGGGKVEDMFEKGYRDFVSLPSARKAYRQLFVDLAKQGSVPALFHCTTGKDRTGWAAAALLALLGVPEQGNLRRLPAQQRLHPSGVSANHRCLHESRRRSSHHAGDPWRESGLPEGILRRDADEVRYDRRLFHEGFGNRCGRTKGPSRPLSSAEVGHAISAPLRRCAPDTDSVVGQKAKCHDPNGDVCFCPTT